MIATHSILMALPELAAQLQRGDVKAAEPHRAKGADRLGGVKLAGLIQRSRPHTKRDQGMDRLAVVELAGLIDGDSASRVAAGLARAAANPRIGGIALLVDSGGGYADAAFPLAEAVREAAAVKPVHVHVGGTIASGAYLAAAHATTITVSEWSAVGSIGTYAVILDTTEMLRRIGIRFHLVAAGRFKAKGLPGVEVSEEHLADSERVVNSINRLFLAAVASGRSIPMKTLVTELATGQVWIGREALERDLVDKIQPLSEFMAELLGRYPSEQFMDLHGDAALAKACELLNVKRLSEADAAAKVALEARYPTLMQRAEGFKKPPRATPSGPGSVRVR
jgi:signal peptide peptidase SppA